MPPLNALELVLRRCFQLKDPRFVSCLIGLLLVSRQWSPWYVVDCYPSWEEAERWAHLLWAQALAALLANPRNKWTWYGSAMILAGTFGFIPWLLWGHGASLLRFGTGITFLLGWGLGDLLTLWLGLAVPGALLAAGIREDIRAPRILARSLLGSGIFLGLVVLLAIGTARGHWTTGNTVRCYAMPILFAFAYWSIILWGKARSTSVMAGGMGRDPSRLPG